MKCPECGIELLGSMKKCPKCGFNTEMGEIDRDYLNAIYESKGAAESDKQSAEVITCEGRYKEGNTRTKIVLVKLTDDALEIFVSADDAKRRMTVSLMGLIPAAILGVLDEDYKLIASYKIARIRSIASSSVFRESYGRHIEMIDQDAFDVIINEKVAKELDTAIERAHQKYAQADTRRDGDGEPGVAIVNDGQKGADKPKILCDGKYSENGKKQIDVLLRLTPDDVLEICIPLKGRKKTTLVSEIDESNEAALAAFEAKYSVTVACRAERILKITKSLVFNDPSGLHIETMGGSFDILANTKMVAALNDAVEYAKYHPYQRTKPVQQIKEAENKKKVGNGERFGIYCLAAVIASFLSALMGSSHVSLLLWLICLGIARWIIDETERNRAEEVNSTGQQELIYFCPNCGFTAAETKTQAHKCPDCGSVMGKRPYTLKSWNSMSDFDKNQIRENWATSAGIVLRRKTLDELKEVARTNEETIPVASCTENIINTVDDSVATEQKENTETQRDFILHNENTFSEGLQSNKGSTASRAEIQTRCHACGANLPAGTTQCPECGNILDS